MKGQRSISDFFHILDCLILAVNADGYKLQQLDDDHRPLAVPPIERSSAGNIAAGSYLIESTVEGGEIVQRWIPTFFDFLRAGTGSPSKPKAKKARHDGSGSTASEKLDRDPTDDSQSFKMRLINRDKGCVVCLAAGIQEFYEFREDSNRFEGARIIDVALNELWDTRGYSALVSDPFTDPTNADNPFASPTTRTKKDLRRINSLENGILLCPRHHKDYDHFRFAISPKTHKIFSFHPATIKLQGVKVKAPWDGQDVLYPPPHSEFLETHYSTSISRAMKGDGDDRELDDDDDDYEELEDYEELSEPEECQNEKVRIWLHDSLSGSEIMSSLDFTAENKGNIETSPLGIISV
jgi:hypothetical protein